MRRCLRQCEVAASRERQVDSNSRQDGSWCNQRPGRLSSETAQTAKPRQSRYRFVQGPADAGEIRTQAKEDKHRS